MKEKGNLTQISSWVFIFLYSRKRQRSARYKNNVNFDNLKDMESIFKCIHNYITDIKNAFYHIPIVLNNTRKKHL